MYIFALLTAAAVVAAFNEGNAGSASVRQENQPVI
jgi:hypothetical protein